MRIKIDNLLSNNFTKRFKWVDLEYLTKTDRPVISLWNDGAVDLPFKVTRNEGSRIETIPAHFPLPSPYPNQNLAEQVKFIANIPDTNSWVGDPQHVLFDEATQLYYLWSIARYGKDFGSDWFEWTSTDLKSWKFNTIRLLRGRECPDAESSYVGGSVVVSNGKFYPKGYLLYIVTTQANNDWTDSRGTVAKKAGGDITVMYVSKGFNQPIDQTLILNTNFIGGDFRDSYGFYDGDDLYVAIASGGNSTNPQYNGSIVISKINSTDYKDWQEATEFLKSEPFQGKAVDFGVEVPNVIRLNEGRWLVMYSDQNYVGAPSGVKPPFYQSCKGWICSRDQGKFTKLKYVQIDFGPDSYARRLVNPYSTKEAPYVFTWGMLHNWYAQTAQDFAKGIVSFDVPLKIYLTDDNNLRSKMLLDPVRVFKGSDFTNPIIVGGITFLNNNGKIKYSYPPSNKNAWNWISPDNMAVGGDDRIVFYEDKLLMQLVNETRGTNMSFMI
jgi:hypothetical protein